VSEKRTVKIEKVLVVDDDPQVAAVVGEILSIAGYRVKKVHSGESAVREALNDPPGLILLDVLMPEMDGYLAAERFREHASLRDIPIIYLTACNPIFEGLTAPKIGIPVAVRKPFSVSELLGAVNAVFGQSQTLSAAVK
jgi:DNA-binding response OmpR family regulator